MSMYINRLTATCVGVHFTSNANETLQKILAGENPLSPKNEASYVIMKYYNQIEHVMKNRTMFFLKGCDIGLVTYAISLIFINSFVLTIDYVELLKLLTYKEKCC